MFSFFSGSQSSAAPEVVPRVLPEASVLPPPDCGPSPSPPTPDFFPVSPSSLIPLGLSLFHLGAAKHVIERTPQGRFHALEGLCAHKQGELWLGDLVEVEDVASVVCPRHRSKFPGGLHMSCHTGKFKCLQPTSEPVRGEWGNKVYETCEAEGWLFVKG